MSLAQYNARKMYKKNNTKAYIKDTFTPAEHKFIREEAHKQDGSQSGKSHLHTQGVADQDTGNANKSRREALQKKKQTAKAALDAKLAGFKPQLDVGVLEKSPGTVKAIELQLEWHRKFDKDIPKKSTMKNKAEKLGALIAAVKRLNTGEVKITQVDEEVNDIEEEAMGTEEEMDQENSDFE